MDTNVFMDQTASRAMLGGKNVRYTRVRGGETVSRSMGMTNHNLGWGKGMKPR